MQRSTFSLSGLTADDMPAIATYLADVAAGERPDPQPGLSDPIRYMAENVKAYYMEAANEQFGAAPPGGARMWTSFYHKTRMGEVMYDLRDRLAADHATRTAANGGNRPPGPPPVNPISGRFAERPQVYCPPTSHRRNRSIPSGIGSSRVNAVIPESDVPALSASVAGTSAEISWIQARTHAYAHHRAAGGREFRLINR